MNEERDAKMQNGERAVKYINKETGEFFQKVSNYDLIFDDTEGYLLWHNWHKVYKFPKKKLPDCFSFADRGRIDVLRDYLQKGSQLLVYRSSRKLHPIDLEKLQQILRLGKTQTWRFLKKAKENNILKEVAINGVKYYAFNPAYGIAGKRISLTTYLIFQEEFFNDLDFPRWVITKFTHQAKEIEPDISILK